MASAPLPSPPYEGGGPARPPSRVRVTMQAVHGVVIVKGPAGSAPLIATAIDRAAPAGVVATVAGNDTTLVILRTGAVVEETVSALRTLLGTDGAEPARLSGAQGGAQGGGPAMPGSVASPGRVRL